MKENKRKAAILILLFSTICFGVTGLVLSIVLPLLISLGLGLIVAIGGGFLVWARATHFVLSVSKATPADPIKYASSHNIIEGLCISAGLPNPQIYVIDSPAINAFSIGTNYNNSYIIFTQGLVEALSIVELEAICAHELSHIKALDIAPATLAAILFSPIINFLSAELILDKMLNVTRKESLADKNALFLTRYPPALVSALNKISNSEYAMNTSPAISFLWLKPALPQSQLQHSPSNVSRNYLFERIEALKEL